MSCVNNFGDINETFIIEPLVLDDTFVTGFTLSSNNIILTQNRIDQYSAFTISLSGITGSSAGVYVTGGTYNNSTGTATFVNSTGGTFQVTGFTTGSTSTASGDYLPLSGGTVTGNTIFTSGLTANTISATTISGGTFYGDGSQLTGIVAIAVFTGGTVSGATLFTVGLSATTISAETYSNLPNTLYTGDGSLSGNRIVDIGTNSLNFDSSSYPNTLFLSNGNVSINTASPVTNLDVRGGVHMGVGTPTIYAGNSHTVEITSSGGAAPLSLIGGSATVELWTDYGPTTAVMFGAGAPGAPADGDFHFSTYNVADTWKDRLIIKNSTGYIGIGTSTITNVFHVSGVTNPVRFEGLTSASDNNLLTVDLSGVVHTIALSAITGSSVTSGAYLPLSGGTVTGNTIFNSGLTANTLNVIGNTLLSGLTATTISATTYQNLPKDIFVTGGTYSGSSITFTNNSGGTFQVSGITTSTQFTGGTVNGPTIFTSGLTANTISATTYFNLPTDIRTTGATYSNNTFTFTTNSGGTANTYSVLFNTVTGLTANSLTVTGNTLLSGLTAATISATTLTIGGSSTFKGSITATTLTGTTDRVVQVSSGGTVSASIDIISAYISSASTAATLLSTASNWTIYGVYTGTSISGTYMGQKHYDDNYFYEAVADNYFIRYIRG